jgi:hypothetical protein
MALHTPAEFPLGLVFVVGIAAAIERNSDADIQFMLIERGYQLRCRLTARLGEQIKFNEGDTVRVTGHLAFDPLRVDYYLLARDLEITGESRAVTEARNLKPLLAELGQAAQAASLAPARLPDWVKELAPPELRDQLALIEGQHEPVEVEAAPPDSESSEQTAVHDNLEPAYHPDELTPELATFLSKAIDSDEDVELTSELLAEYSPQTQQHRPAFKVAYPYDVQRAPQPERIHWAIAVIIILIVLVLFAVFTYLAVTIL